MKGTRVILDAVPKGSPYPQEGFSSDWREKWWEETPPKGVVRSAPIELPEELYLTSRFMGSTTASYRFTIPLSLEKGALITGKVETSAQLALLPLIIYGIIGFFVLCLILPPVLRVFRRAPGNPEPLKQVPDEATSS